MRLGDAGEVDRIAASVIDGIKIPRIEDLQAEAAVGPPASEVSWQADRHGRRCGTKLDQPLADFHLWHFCDMARYSNEDRFRPTICLRRPRANLTCL